MKYVLKKIMLMLVVCTVFFCNSTATAAATGMYVEYHTKEEIRSFVKRNKIDLNGVTSYTQKPKISAPYRLGKLKESSLNDGINALNIVRYIAGIPADVQLDADYNELAQAASVCNAANNTLSHMPSMPYGMSYEFYEKAKEGAGSSNIAMASWDRSLSYDVIRMWMEDGDAYNIDRIGHRRWLLNPGMQKTGFGMAGGYSAVYAFDNIVAETDYYGVAWPAQNMPVEYFQSQYPWSVSMGYYVDASAVRVTLTRYRDGKIWTFRQGKKKGYFNVNNEPYGAQGCIIFRPDNLSYKAGDEFHVQITGLEEDVDYTVRFFKL